MKYPNIVYTDFIEQLVDELNHISCSIGAGHHFTAKQLTVSRNQNLAHEVMEKAIQQNIEFLNYAWEDNDEESAIEFRAAIISMDKTHLNLNLLCDLGGATYATPDNIESSVTTLVAKLTEQYNAKIEGSEIYDEYYFQTLIDVLQELLELIKEGCKNAEQNIIQLYI